MSKPLINLFVWFILVAMLFAVWVWQKGNVTAWMIWIIIGWGVATSMWRLVQHLKSEDDQGRHN